MPDQNQIAESRGEAFDLTLDPVAHFFRRAVRNMTVAPGDMPPGGAAAGIKLRWLRKQNKRAFIDSSRKGVAFGRADFFQRSTQMQCTRLAARIVEPRN